MSKKRSTLSNEERDEFRRAMKDVGRLKPSTKHHHADKPKPLPYHHREINDPEPEIPFVLENLSEEHWVSGQDNIQFSRSGLQQRLLTKFHRGQIPIEASLDLHRCTVEEALRKTERFIKQSQTQKMRVVCVIHGKGHFSANGKPLIKNALNQYLRTHEQVLAFSSAHPRHGGAGAVYVLLKLI